MINVKETRIRASDVRSLIWCADLLLDWVGGGRRFSLDGKIFEPCRYYGYTFDAAIASPSGEFAAIYTRLGTKGLILRRGEIVREINRAYYEADVYEFPIALIRLYDGRELIVHCPNNYNQLEIDDLATGESLIDSTERTPSDFFHSRLAGSPDGKYLLSAGWAWHPLDAVHLYNLAEAIADPGHLDCYGLGINAAADDGISAAFLPTGELAVDLVGFYQETPGGSNAALRVFDPTFPATPKVILRSERLGTMMAIGNHHLLGLYEHPKLVDLRTGEVVRRWMHIDSGVQTSSIVHHLPAIPTIALDYSGQRCAIANAEGIDVLEFLPD